MDSEARSTAAAGWRLGQELPEYLATSAYLYVCFAALLFYKAVILRGYGIDYAPFGLAAVKALLLAKFMLIGSTLGLGTRFRGGTLLHAILRKSVLFLLLLMALSVVEEAIVGLIHHRTIGRSLAELVDGRLGTIVATSLLLWLILIPYFAYKELDVALGDGKLRQLLRRHA